MIWIKLASKQERGANEAFSTYTFEDYSAFNYLQARGTASLACFSSIFLCPSSLTVVQLESELFFLGGGDGGGWWGGRPYLKFLTQRKMFAKQGGQAARMGCHITSGLSLTPCFICRGLKLLFFGTFGIVFHLP